MNAIIQAQRDMSEKDLIIFNGELQRNTKSTGLTYVLWFFFGALGVHQFYMGKILRGIEYLAVFIVGYIIIFAGFGLAMHQANNGLPVDQASSEMSIVGICLLGVLGLQLLWDMITIPRQLRRREDQIKQKLLEQLKSTV